MLIGCLFTFFYFSYCFQGVLRKPVYLINRKFLLIKICSFCFNSLYKSLFSLSLLILSWHIFCFCFFDCFWNLLLISILVLSILWLLPVKNEYMTLMCFNLSPFSIVPLWGWHSFYSKKSSSARLLLLCKSIRWCPINTSG